MNTSKYIIITLIIVGLLFTVTMVKPYTLATTFQDVAAQTLDESGENKKFNIKLFSGAITSVTNTSIYVESDEFTGELFARGKWLYIDSEFIGFGNWAKVKDYISEGQALIMMLSINKNDKIINVLLGLKQEDVILLRPRVLKHYAVKHAHTRNYFGVYGTILHRGENYMLIDNNGRKAIVVVGINSTWYKAGSGVTTWKEIRSEFKDGDRIRVFCHNILVLNSKFAEYFGFNAIIWGYSGSIIDLTSGTSITRYLGEG